MDPIGPAEPRLLHVERGIEAMDRQIRALKIRSIALAQGIWQEWGEINAVGVGGGSPSDETLTGTLLDNCGNAVVGATIDVNAHGGGLLATTTSGAGGAISVLVSVPFGVTSIDVVITATGFATVTLSGIPLSGFALGTVTIGSGVQTITNGCATFCAAATQTLVDSIYGSVTLTWNGTLWQGTHSGVSYPGYGGGSCSAATISITYQLLTGGNINVKWQVNGSFCPVASGTGVTLTFSGIANCSGATPVITATNSSASSEPKNFRQGASSQTFTVTLA